MSLQPEQNSSGYFDIRYLTLFPLLLLRPMPSLATEAEPIELPVSEVRITGSKNFIVSSRSSQACEKVTLNPQGINQEYHMSKPIFPLALLGWGCVPSKTTVFNYWQGDLPTIVCRFFFRQHHHLWLVQQ
jgi:hypothetical protein